MVKKIVRPLPVLYACKGCAEYGQIARTLGGFLDRLGAVELVWLGANPGTERGSRFPIYALDGCERACAARWLEERGIRAERSFVIVERAATQ